MLKETIICIVIVIAIVFGDKVTQNYTKESVSELSIGLMSLREELIQDNIENETLSNKAEGVYRTMERKT